MNRIIISGNLTREPEVYSSKNGKTVVKMSIAVNKYGEGADFFYLAAFDKRADFCKNYLHKGSSVIVEGKLQTSIYTDKDGYKRTNYEILIDNIEFAGKKKDADDTPPFDDSVPF